MKLSLLLVVSPSASPLIKAEKPRQLGLQMVVVSYFQVISKVGPSSLRLSFLVRTKDDTPGCTKEACAYRDASQNFEANNTVILGVSPDNEKSHKKFIDKFDLPFQLLCDTDKDICEAYGVWVEKSMYGKKYMGVERSTFLIDENGNLAAVRRKVKPEPHVAEMLELAGGKS